MAEGLISRYLNRRLSRPLARLLVFTPLTPNFISFLSFLIGLASATAFFKGQNVLGGILAQTASVMDGVDGDLARLKGKVSSFGAFFDSVLDRYADAAIILGLTWWSSQAEKFTATCLIGILALLGSLLFSYSRARAESSFSNKTDVPLLSELGSRDGRLFLIMLGGILGKGYWSLLVIAFLTHLTVLLRILHFRRKEL